MASKMQRAIERAQEYAGEKPSASRHNQDYDQKYQGVIPETKPKIHRLSGNSLNPSLQAQDHDGARNGFLGVDAEGKPRSKGRVSLSKIVNSDPAFVMAITEWGMKGCTLNYQCQRLGIDRIRKIILCFSRWNRAYFTNIAGYVARVMQNAKPSDKDAVPTTATLDYERWLARHGLRGDE